MNIIRNESVDDLTDVLLLLEGEEQPGGSPTTLEEAIEILNENFPGFWWRGGTCHLSSEAIIAPDHNCPKHGERLLREYPPTEKHWNEGVEVEIRPGSDAALCRALLAAVIERSFFDVEFSPRPAFPAITAGAGR